jgi:hypothetical protein
MKLVKAERICVKCKVSKLWTDYQISWTDTWENSYVRRTCKACEGDAGPDTSAEARAISKELAALAKKRVQVAQKLDDIDLLISEKLQQLALFK